MFKGPAIALLELESIARGYVVADAMVKRAPVRLLMTEAVSPGKFLVLCDGEVGDVDEAFREGMELAGSAVLDSLYLPQAHPGLSHALQGKAPRPALDSLGIVETQTVCSALLSADAALKGAEVTLVDVQLARGIGGKGWYSVTGTLASVEAAMLLAAAAIAPELLLTTETIARPHPDLLLRLGR